MEAVLLIIDGAISLCCFVMIIIILQREDLWATVSRSLVGWRERLLRFAFTMMAGGFFWKMVMKDRFTMQDYLIDGGIIIALLTFLRSNQKLIYKKEAI